MEKGGLTAALIAAGATAGAAAWHAAEMRLGLRGQVRRVLAPRGVKVAQRVQVRYERRYLLLGVDPASGAIRWHWLERLRQEHLVPALAAWRWGTVVWDGAGAHRGKRLASVATRRVFLPPYSPELNPAERVFEEVRRHVEGIVYAAVADKQAAADRYLSELAADPARVRRLCGWGWLTDALAALPDA